MFTELAIDGFRRLRKLRLPLRPIGVMIGANGTGKSTLLEAMGVLGGAARGRLRDEISRLNGLHNLLTADSRQSLSLGVARTIPDGGVFSYDLELGLSGPSYAIQGERLWTGQPPSDVGAGGRALSTDDGFSSGWATHMSEADLAAAPRTARMASLFRDALASTSYHHLVNVAPRSPGRSPEQIQPSALPGNQGENLTASLHALRDTDRNRFEWLEEILGTAFPGFDRIEFPVVASGTVGLSWRDRRFPARPFGAHELSDGALRFLWLASILVSPNLGALTMIDEPELSLHPDLVRLVADLLREASNRTQLLVATQSDRLVRFLEPSEVIVVDSDQSGDITMTWADKLPDLDKWLEDYSLEQLWRMGEIGGRSS